eukprot:GHVQ01017111.1.p1 GENE.GHVQ01017111.1~~GHVQ01017111.1.p1  ORF type:complete len:315 (-),score=73.10 GHVQ01017111.1:106-1050(-)
MAAIIEIMPSPPPPPPHPSPPPHHCKLTYSKIQSIKLPNNSIQIFYRFVSTDILESFSLPHQPTSSSSTPRGDEEEVGITEGTAGDAGKGSYRPYDVTTPPSPTLPPPVLLLPQQPPLPSPLPPALPPPPHQPPPSSRSGWYLPVVFTPGGQGGMTDECLHKVVLPYVSQMLTDPITALDSSPYTTSCCNPDCMSVDRKVKPVKRTVLGILWDRRNCGMSSVRFDDADNQTENDQQADDLAYLLSSLGFVGPRSSGGSILVGTSSGGRMSLLCAQRHPHVVRGLVLNNLTGGQLASDVLAEVYYGQYISILEGG